MKKISLFLLPFFLIAWLGVAFAGYEINVVTGKLDKTRQPSSIVDFDPSNYGGVNWGDSGTLTPFNWGWNSGSTKPNITFGNGSMDFYNTTVTIHGTNSQFKFANNMFFNGDTARKLLLGSTGGTYNEDIRIDNDTTTNTIALDSTTGVTSIDSGTIGIRNTATNNSFGNVSIGTAGTAASVIAAAGNVSIGTAYAVAHAAPSNGVVIQGNVGIGTWLPTKELEVAGVVKAQGFETSSTTQGSVVFYEAAANGSNTVTVSAPSSVTSNRSCVLEDDATPFDNCVTTGSSPGGTSGAIQYNDGGTLGGDTTKVVLNGSNMGVGTINPVSTLQVVGTITATAFSGDGSGLTGIGANSGWTDGGTNVYNTTTSDTVGVGTTTPTAKFMISNVGTGETFRADDSLNDASPMIITSAGNVGIGTTVPSKVFQFGSDSTSNFITMDTINAPSMAIRADAATSVDQLNIQANYAVSNNLLEVSSSSPSLTTPMALFTLSGASNVPALQVSNTASTGQVVKFSDVASDTTPMAIDVVGNVGIGTFVPTAQLDIRNQGVDVLKVSSTATGTLGDYLIITSSGNVGIGTTTIPANKLVIGAANSCVGKANCTTTNGAQGCCSSVVGADGSCTCTAF